MSERVRLSLDVSLELNTRLETLTAKLGGSKSDALRKAISLLELSVNASARGLRTALVNDNGKVITEIYWL